MNKPFDLKAPEDDLHDFVRGGYGDIARKGVWLGHQLDETPEGGGCCAGGSCCGPVALDAETLAARIGYTVEELSHIPVDANLGLSCGNPGAIAGLRPGEVVLDLGSGAGFDAFLCGPRVGADGRVIGIDMTADMLNKARLNAREYAEKTGLENVEFRLGEIEHLPVADGAVDVVISNCVINLSPRKDQVWREIHRVLKDGGRVAISDMALFKPLPEAVRGMAAAWIGCVSGAVEIRETEAALAAAGFRDVRLEPKSDYVDSMTEADDPLYRQIAAALPVGERCQDYITSLYIHARK